MLRETTTEDIIYGYRECCKVGKKLGIPVVYNTCVRELMDELLQDAKTSGISTKVLDIPAGIDYDGTEAMHIYPLTLQMRPSWLDQEI